MSERETPCDDECVDPRCRWFYIHGKRTGSFEGITPSVPVASTRGLPKKRTTG